MIAAKRAKNLSLRLNLLYLCRSELSIAIEALENVQRLRKSPRRLFLMSRLGQCPVSRNRVA